MLRFTLFQFPVAVHWMFWVNCALISGSMENLPVLLIFAAAAFVSILIHELGHAFLMRHYRARASILLYALGGLAIPTGARFSRGANILISLAGPAVQIAVGLLALQLARMLELSASYGITLNFLHIFFYISIFWGLLNLIPIFPLDGGHILNGILGPRRWRLTLQISIGCCAVLILWCLLTQRFYNAIILGMLAYSNINRLKGDRTPTILDPV
jgi:Zn-dependent protease